MKLNFHSPVLLLFFLFLFSSRVTSGRLLASKHGQEDINVNKINNGVSIEETEEGNNSFKELMGMKDCESVDQDCLNTRTMSEVHLDYIYTQHHNP